MFRAIILAVAALLFAHATAEARVLKKQDRLPIAGAWCNEGLAGCPAVTQSEAMVSRPVRGSRVRGAHGGESRHAGGLGPRPRAWCGWWMRGQVDQDPGPAFNLARNWARWGVRISGPQEGALGVQAHHVFKVLAVTGPGKVLAISGNDGHAVRTRERSTGRVIAWVMPGYRTAQR